MRSILRHALVLCGLLLPLAAGALQLHDDVERPDPAQAKTGQSQVEALGDEDNVSVYRLQGDYDRDLAAPRFAVAQRFYETHPDEFDFLIAFTAFEFPTGEALAFYNQVRNDVQGVGLDPFDHSAAYGSAGRLQGYIDMAALSRYDFNTRSADFRSPLNTLVHEIMHRWSVRLRYEDAQGVPREDLLGRDGSHWSLLASTEASLMYGARWQEGPPGHFTVVEARQRLGWWDLYLAGLADVSELPDLALLSSEDVAAGDLPEVGLSVQGTREFITPAQVVAAEGPRLPAAAVAPRRFDAALLLLLRPGEQADPRDLAKLERFRVAFEQYFQAITRGRATLRLHLRPQSAVVPAAPASLAMSPVSPRPQPLEAALQWLQSQQRSDGRWEDRPGTSVRDSTVALEAVAELDPQAAALVPARQWLAARGARNLDEYAWLQLAQPTLSIPGASALNADGGYGLLASWSSSPLDTVRMLAARSIAVQPNAATLAQLTAFLRARQNPDGSFAPVARGAGRVAVSVAAAEQLLRGDDAANHAAAGQARAWLVARFDAPSLQEEEFTLAEVAELTLRGGTLDLPESIRTALAQYLLSQQGADGDWRGSVYTTAVAALALARESRPNLVPVAAAALPAEPVSGDSVRLRLRIANRGAQSASASQLRWYDGDPQAGGTPLTATLPLQPMLAGNETVLDAWIETAGLSGTRELYAVVDLAADVEESREDDNTLRFDLALAPPPEGADLALEARDFAFEPAIFDRVPSTVTLSGLIRNVGNGAAAQTTIRAVHLRGTQQETLAQMVLDVAAGAQQPFELDLPIARPEAHRIRLIADPDNAVPEARENNNSTELLLPFADSIDFEPLAETLDFDPDPVLGADTTIRVTVANRGTQQSPNSLLALERHIDGDWQREATAALSLAGGAQEVRQLVWRPPSEGPHQLRLRADPDATVAEIDEDNNIVSLQQTAVRSDAPALSVLPDSIEVAPLPVLQGQPLQVQADVGNSGESDAGAFDVEVYRGDPRAGGVRIGGTRVEAGLAADAQTTVQIAVAEYSERGDGHLFVRADSADEIPEHNENDNYGVRLITALGLPDLTVTLGAIALTPGAPVVGAPAQAQVTIVNIGEQPSGAAPVRLYELAGGQRSEIPSMVTLPVLAPGASHVAQWDWIFGSIEGVQALSVEIDRDNQLREFDELNNEVTLLVDTQDGDAFVTEPYFSPNGDGVRDQTRAVFAAGAGLDYVIVVDHAGRERRRIESLDDLGNGAVGALWDGRDEQGRVASDGRYGMLAQGANGQVAGPVYAVLDNDRAMALEAVNSEDGVYKELAESINGWVPGPEGTLAEDYVYAIGHEDNELMPLQRGVLRSHALLGGVEPVISTHWLDDYAQDNGLISLEPVQVSFLPDGRLFIAMHEFGGANRTLLFTQAPSDIDQPMFLAALDERERIAVLGPGDAQRLVIGVPEIGPWRLLDPASGALTLIQNAGAIEDLRLLGVMPSGLLLEEVEEDYYYYYSSRYLFVPFDAGQPVRETPNTTIENEDSFEFFRRISLLPGTHSYLLHVKGYDYYHDVPEQVFVVDARDGQMRLVYGDPESEAKTRDARSGNKAYAYAQEPTYSQNADVNLALRAFWLERQQRLVVLDHAAAQVLHFDHEGRPLGQTPLPALALASDAVNDAELGEATYSGLHGSWLSIAHSRLGFEARHYDADGGSLYVSTGIAKTFFDNADNFYFGDDAAVDFLRVGPDGSSERLGGRAAVPLYDPQHIANYPYIYDLAASERLPAAWPRFIHANGTRLQWDGRVVIPHQGRVSAAWPYADRLIGASPSQSRLLLDDGTICDSYSLPNGCDQPPESGEEPIAALYSTLERLTAVLRASSNGRAVRLSGVATDRNFDYAQIDWASLSALDEWNVLMPPTSEEIRFDDFLTWAPPQAGAYLFRLRVVDRAGNRRERYATSEVAFGAPIGGLRQNHRAISPNGDTVQDVLELSFNVLQPTEQRFEIRDFAGRLVRHEDLVFGELELGAQTWNWDGRDDQGDPVAEGRYRVELSSGFVLRVNVDITPPQVQAELIQPRDHFDANDLELALQDDEPMTGVGPVIDHSISEVFDGRAVDARWALESAAIGSSDWRAIEPFRQLEFDDHRRQAALTSAQYVGRRFRIAATDAAGNRSVAEAGTSEASLLFVHADSLRDWLPPIQAVPYGLAQGVPTYGRSDGPPRPVVISDHTPLFALDLAGDIAELMVDELVGQGWIVRQIAAPELETESQPSPRLPQMAGHLQRVAIDLSEHEPGDQVTLRLRARYEDTSEAISNALRITLGGVDLSCGVEPQERPSHSLPFEARPHLEEPVRNFVLEIATQELGVLERLPGTYSPALKTARFAFPDLSGIRQRHGLPAGYTFRYRATAVDGEGRAAQSKWRDCEVAQGAGENTFAFGMRPVFAPVCDATPSRRVQAMVKDPLHQGHEHRLILRSALLAQPIEIGIELGHAGEHYFPLDTTAWAQGNYQAELQRRTGGSEPGAWSTVRDSDFVVDHVAPQAQLFAPLAGERICAGSPQAQINGQVDDLRRAGYKVELRKLGAGDFDPFHCDGYGVQGAACEEKTPDFGPGGVSDFIRQAPLDVDHALPNDAGDGSFELRLRASDWSGAQVCDTIPIELDAGVQFEERALPDPRLPGERWPTIAPGSNGDFREATWHLRAYEHIGLHATLYQALPSEEKIFGPALANLPVPPEEFGDIDFVWGGLVDALPDGFYGIVFRAEDDCGNQDEIVRFVELDATPPQLELTAPQDGAPLSAVTVAVVGLAHDPHFAGYDLELSVGGESWLTLANGQRPVYAPRVLAQWATSGALGTHRLRLSAEDQLGNHAQVVHQFDLQAHEDVLQAAHIEPPLFSPNDDGQLDSAALELVLRRDASLLVRVLDAQDAPVRTLAQDLAAGAGPTTLVWDGRDGNGQVVPDGEYLIEVNAADAAQPENIDTVELPLTVDTQAPVLDPIDPQGAFANCEMLAGFGVEDIHLAGFEASLQRQGAVVVTRSGRTTGYHSVAVLSEEAEGDYELALEADDEAGNRSEASHEFTLDCTAPEAALALQDGQVLPRVPGQAIALDGRALDAHLLRYVIELEGDGDPEPVVLFEGTQPVDGARLYDWTPNQPDGDYLLRLRVEDRAGNHTLQEVSIRLDGTPPTAIIDPALNGTVVGPNFVVNGTATDANLLGYRIEAATPAQADQGRWSILFERQAVAVENDELAALEVLLDGDIVLRLVVEDHAGLSASDSIALRIDNVPPPAPVLSGVLEDLHHVRLSWAMPATEDLAEVRVYRNGVHIATRSDGANFHLDDDTPQGELVYHVIATDEVGNHSEPSNTVSVKVDRNAPEVQLFAPLDGERVRGLYDIAGIAQSRDNDLAEWELALVAPNDEIEVLRRSPAAVSGGVLHSWDTRALTDETPLRVRLSARDLIGNQASVEVDVIVDNEPPAAPTGLIAVDGGPQVQVDWDPNVEPDLLGYLLYRGGELVGHGSALPADLRPLAITANTYADAAAPDGELAYRIYAIDRAGNISPPSATFELLRDAGPPELEIVRPGADEAFEEAIEILAQGVDQDIVQVVFEFRAVGGGNWSAIGAPVTELPWRATFQPDDQLPHGEYELRAVATDAGALTDPDPPVVVVRYADLTPPAAPVGVLARATGAQVGISWQANAEPDLAGYRVERLQGSGVWVPLQEDPLVATQTIDPDRPLGEQRYRVRAVDESDNASAPSTPDTAQVFDLALLQPYTPVGEAQIAVEGVAHTRGGQLEYRVEGENDVAQGTGDDVAAFAPFTVPEVPLFVGANQVAINLLDAEGNRSIAAAVPVRRGEIPLPPTGLEGAVDAEDITLNWQASASGDVIGYRVFRNGRVLGLDARVAQSLSAMTELGSQPALIDEDPGTLWTRSAPLDSAEFPAPVQVTLSWDQPALISGLRLSFADADRSIAAYRVFALDADAGWMALGARSERRGEEETFWFHTPYPTRSLRVEIERAQAPGASIQVKEIEPLQRNLVTPTEYVDSVADGQYEYTVTAVSALGLQSEPSLPWEVAIGDAEAPPPVNLSGELNGADALLQWTESVALDLGGYAIYRNGVRIAQVPAQEPRSYLDAGLPNGNYIYTVSAEDTHFNESALSNQVELDVTQDGPGQPVIDSVEPEGDLPALRIRWHAGAGTAPAQYRLYVGAEESDVGSPYQVLLTLAADEYLHQGLQPGQRYWYRVQAIDAQGNAGELSAPASGEARDLLVPATPQLHAPTVPGVPINWSQSTYRVCGTASSGANVILVRNGLPLIEVEASSGDAVALPFARRGLNVLQSPQGDAVFLPGLPGENNPGWFYLDDGARAEAFDRYGALTVARYDRFKTYVIAVDQYGSFSEIERNEEYSEDEESYLLYNNPPEGVIKDFAPNGYTYLVLTEHNDQSLHLYAWDISDYSQEIVLPDGRVPAIGSLAWDVSNGTALFADTDGRIYRVEDSGYGAMEQIGAGATRAGPLIAPWKYGTPAPAWIAIDEAGARVLRFAADGAPPLVLLDDGRLPLAAAWAPDGKQIALRFVDMLEFRDAATGALFQAVSQPEILAGLRYVLQWNAPTQVLLTADSPSFTPWLTAVPGLFCTPDIAAIPGDNLIEAIAENASGLRSPTSDPILIRRNGPAPGQQADLELEQEDLRLFPTVAALDEQRIAYVGLRHDAHDAEESDEIVQVRATLILPGGSRRIVEREAEVHFGDPQTASLAFDLGRMTQLGSYRLVVEADPQDAITESDENNNSAVLEWQVDTQARAQLNLSSEETQVLPGDSAHGRVEVLNPGPSFDGEIVMQVNDAGGSLGELSRFALQALPAGQTRGYEWTWEVPEDLLAGEYTVQARLLDVEGEAIAERSLPVSVGGQSEFVLTLQPQRLQAPLGQPLPVRVGIDYPSGNQAFDGGTLRLYAGPPGGPEQLLWQGATGALLPGYSVRRDVVWSNPQNAGTQQLRLQFVTAALERTLAREVQFTAPDAPQPVLLGEIELAPAPQVVLGGTASVLHIEATNPGALALPGTELRLQVLAEGGVTPLLEHGWNTDLGAGANFAESLDLVGLGNQPLGYVARLDARLAGDAPEQWRALATLGFRSVDGEAPLLQLIAPDVSTPRRAPALLAVRIVDRHSRVEQAAYRVDGGEWRTLSAGGIDGYEALLHGLADGAHQLALRARDVWGNEALSEGHTFVIDSTAPLIDISGVSDEEQRNTAAEPVIAIEDAHPDGYSAWLDGAPFQSGTPVDAEGEHHLRVLAIDTAGNRRDRVLVFTIDYSAPPLSIVSPADGASTPAETIVVRVASEAGASVQLSVGGYEASRIAALDGIAQFDAVPLQLGANAIEALATDAAQNSTGPVAIGVTRLPPPGELTGVLVPAANEIAHGNDLPLQVQLQNETYTDFPALPLRLRAVGADASVLYEELLQANLPPGAGQMLDRLLPAAAWPWGPVTLVLEGDIGAGYFVLDSTVVTVIDVEPPQLQPLAPLPDSVQPGTVELRAVATDDRGVSAVEYRLDGGEWLALPNLAADVYGGDVESSDGPHTLRWRVRDAAGNQAESVDIDFTVDAIAPQIVIDGVAEDQTYGQSVTPQVEVLDAHPDQLLLTLDGAPFVSGTLVEAEGVHHLYAEAIDAAGNRSERTLDFTIDRSGPALSFVQPQPDAVIAADRVLVLGTTEAGADVTLTTQGFVAQVQANGQGGFSVADVPLIEGENLLTAQATDAIGNVGEAAQLRVYRSGSTAGGLHGGIVPHPQAVPAGADFDLEFEVSEDVGLARAVLPLRIELRRAGEPGVLWTHERSIALGAGQTYVASEVASSEGLALGGHLATLLAQHEGEWLELASAAFAVVDVAAPVVTFLAPAPLSLHRDEVAVHVAVVDESAVAQVQVRVDGGSWQKMTALGGDAWSLTLTLPREGILTIDARARDVHGNLGNPVAVDVRVDRTPPVIQIEGVSEGQSSRLPLTPWVTTEDASATTLELTLDGAPFISGTAVAQEGEHLLEASAEDAAGNQSARQLGFRIDTAPPPLSVVYPLDGAKLSTPAIDVTGITEPLAAVELLLHGVLRSVQADADGAFVFVSVPLLGGENPMALVATDAAGNLSEPVELSVLRLCGLAELPCGIFSDGFESVAAPGKFASAPGKFASAPGRFASAPGRFASERGRFASAPGKFASTPGRFAPVDDDLPQMHASAPIPAPMPVAPARTPVAMSMGRMGFTIKASTQ